MNSLVRKIILVYRNNGVKGVSAKMRSTYIYRTRSIRRLISQKRKITLEEKQLKDEYDFLSNEIFQVSSKDISKSTALTTMNPKGEIKTAVWFVPHFSHFAFGGIQTIFRFIEKLSIEGVKNYIVIYDNPVLDAERLKTQISEYFPRLKDYELRVFSDDKVHDIDALPESDIAFCTLWVSAYLLLRYNKTKRKYYFIQDYEPLFYVAGSTYALAESTYRFGFRGLVNTPGLLAAINQRHGLEGISFIPSVNQELYYPDPNRSNKKVRIFFYARPFNPRNAFNLGILTIKRLLEVHGKNIEVIAAGAEWNEAEYGLKGKIINKGLIGSIEEVAALYRSCDIGFSFMLNKHPSYQMLEYAASGVATVINYNEDHEWLYKDGENCLLSEPSPYAMAEKISTLINDPKLREKLVKNARKSLAYTWDQSTETVWNDIKKF